MNIVSKIILPIFIIIIIFYGFKKKINIYDTFLEGAKDGLVTVFNIFPAIIAMIFAINIFIDSNVLSFIINLFIPSKYVSINLYNILPMALLRPVSGTASLAIMNNIFQIYGPDSFIGRMASILQGCTDTTIYVIALYFGSIKISKIRYALKVGLFADLIGILVAILLTHLFF